MELKKDPSFREMLESSTYEWQREILQREIQKPALEVDRACFKKTQAEKDQVKTIKLNMPKKKQKMTSYGRFQY